MNYPADPYAMRQSPGTERRRRPRTGRQLPILDDMETEHSMLRAWQSRLQAFPECLHLSSNGSGCQHAREGTCTDPVLRLSEDMLFFLSEHFALEDEVMRRGRGPADRDDTLDLHQEDHGTIMQELVASLGNATPCKQRHAMHSLLHGRFARHLQTHDTVLRRLIADV